MGTLDTLTAERCDNQLAYKKIISPILSQLTWNESQLNTHQISHTSFEKYFNTDKQTNTYTDTILLDLFQDSYLGIDPFEQPSIIL